LFKMRFAMKQILARALSRRVQSIVAFLQTRVMRSSAAMTLS